jgi:hypothetical protein
MLDWSRPCGKALMASRAGSRLLLQRVEVLGRGRVEDAILREFARAVPPATLRLASSDEFAVDPALVKLRKSHSKAAVDEYARLVSPPYL